MPLLDAVVVALEAAIGLRKRYGLRGYLVVGSKPLLGPEVAGSTDSDVVLLATGGTSSALREVCSVLRPDVDDDADRRVWLVTTAVVTILRVEQGFDSLDLLWLGGCTFPGVEKDDAVFVAFEVEDDRYILPDEESLGAEGDSILLTRLFRNALESPSMLFSPELLQMVRQWAKARHLYGSRYG